MLERFCDNPQCRFNRVNDAEAIKQGYWIDKSDSSEGMVHRHEHATDTGEPVFFCDNCHGVIMLFSNGIKSLRD